MNRRSVQLTVLALVLLGATALRVYQLKDVPAGFFCDEAAQAYNGYAIGTTGYDENGKFLPLFIWSFGGYKNPVYIYTDAIITRFFGLDEFTGRLPAALYGVTSVLALFFLGRALFNPWVGLFAAIFAAVAPWHLHLSRIAFDLTAFATFFTTGVTLLVRFTQGRRTLAAAFFFCALCVYAYAIATLFVPLFLIGFGLLYLPMLLRRWRETLLAVVVALVTVAPVGAFYYANRQGSVYLQRTTMVDPNQPLSVTIERYLRNYREFFNPTFLFEHGDMITRHSVREFGELLPVYAPFLLIGFAAVVLRRDRASKLILWWLVLYPAGASLMTEIPTATRAFIGCPAFCLLAGVGLATALWALTILRWRPLVLTLQVAGLAAVAYFLVPQVDRYVRFYFNDYPKYSAPTYGGFQYGYRDSIHFMEPLRSQYDLMMITATEVNQPQIFPLFYNAVDPRVFNKTRDIGYLISDPAFYADYNMNQRILYQLRSSDLAYFSDYEVKKRIIAPGGQEEFVIAEVRKRKNFMTKWLGLGLFLNDNNEGTKTDFIDVRAVSKNRYQTAFGDAYFRPIPQRNVRVDLNGFYATSDPRHPGNPELVCAYALTTVHSLTAQHVFLELAGSGDTGQVWLNGQLLTPWALNIGAAPVRKEISLGVGNNLLIVKSCESIGDWYFTARITDAEGHDASGISFDAEIPADVVPLAAAPVADADFQLINGFDSIVRFKHTQKEYADYRGATESWWTYVYDPEGEVVWLTEPPAAKKRTVAALTVSVSPDPIDGEIYVNGKFALPFHLENERGAHTFTRGGYRMTYVFKAEAAGFSGIALIEVPPSDVTPGQPIELRVVPAKGPEHAWFMVKSYRDTLTHESITPEQITALFRNDWQSSAQP